MAKIGVFDSGVGGQSVATAISLALPDDDVLFINDHENVPYGTKSESELLEMSLPKLLELEAKGCRLIVIACNSVSTTIIGELRTKINIPLIGIEPLIKKATLESKNKVIAVCATPRTLASQRYKELRNKYGKGSVFLEPDCSEWAGMIETDTIDRVKITMAIGDVVEQGADVVVLGCTHYHWIESLIRQAVGKKTIVLQPEEFVVEEVKTVLGQLD